MGNPIFQAMGGGMPGNMGNILGMIQQFQKFRQGFTGDPQAEVQNLLNSGKMSQAQYNQFAQMASAFQRFLK